MFLCINNTCTEHIHTFKCTCMLNYNFVMMLHNKEQHYTADNELKCPMVWSG